MIFHFSRKRDIVPPPPLRAAGKTGERRTGGKSTKVKIRLSDEERERLERIAGNPRSLQKHAWRDRFLAKGVDGRLRDATRPPGKKPIAEDRVKAPVDLAMSPPGIIGEGTPGTGRCGHWRRGRGWPCPPCTAS